MRILWDDDRSEYTMPPGEPGFIRVSFETFDRRGGIAFVPSEESTWSHGRTGLSSLVRAIEVAIDAPLIRAEQH